MQKVLLSTVLLVASAGHAETVKLPVTADVGICAHPREAHWNTGGNSRIRIKGNEHYYLFAFDARPLRHWKISSATLHLKLLRGRLRRVAFCTVATAWVEGTAVNEPQKEATCFTHVKYPETAWTPAGGTMLDATFNSPYMRWQRSDVKYMGKWMEIPIAPDLVQAVAVGLSHGLVMSDEKGQTRENHDVYTRRRASARPYLAVEGMRHHTAAGLQRPPAKAAPCTAASGFRTGAVEVDVSWKGRKALGSRVSLRLRGDPTAGATYEQVTLNDRLVVFDKLTPVVRGQGTRKWSVDIETFVGPQKYQCNVAGVAQSEGLPVPGAAEFQRPETFLQTIAGTDGWRAQVLPITDKAPSPGGIAAAAAESAQASMLPVPITARNAWVGLQVVLLPPNGSASNVSVSVEPPAFAGKRLRTEALPLGHIRLFRTWCVPKAGRYHSEVLVPLGIAHQFDIPWKLNKLPRQVSQAILVDVWVPSSAAPGPYGGKLLVRRDDKTVVAVPLRLQVSDVTLPDQFHVVGSMNTYGPPAGRMAVPRSDALAFTEMERKYYRLAHAHRMTLNALPYSQSGQIGPLGAPEVSGKGADCKVVDWSGWDERFGPLLSGEAFAGKSGYVGPGEGLPVRHMYLPFHENWPAKLAEHFEPWPPPQDYRKFLLWSAGLNPIEDCFDPAFEEAWDAILRQFRDHLAAQKWTRTRYQVYMNNKHYFRDTTRSGGRGISLWLLDEPMFADLNSTIRLEITIEPTIG